MKRIIVCALLVTLGAALADDTIAVSQVKGVGAGRGAALDDAKRNAVEQALGVALQGVTEVKDFELITDVVRSRCEGYIVDYKLVRDTALKDHYEIVMNADVSRSPLKADAKTLQASLGGFRFMVWYDFRKAATQDDSAKYEYAVARANEYLSRKGFRYVDPGVFNRLKTEARQLFPDTTKPLTVAQYMAVQADVPVFIELDQVDVTERSMGGQLNWTGASAIIDASAYDTYTAEGLGSAVGKTDSEVVDKDAVLARCEALDPAAYWAVDKVVFQMMPKLGDWALNGKPYLLRVYGAGSYKSVRALKDSLKNDSRFGGQLEVVSAQDYSQFDLTFKGAADELADAVLDYCARIPALAAIDVAGFYKNQVNFALPGAKVPEAERGIAPGKTK